MDIAASVVVLTVVFSTGFTEQVVRNVCNEPSGNISRHQGSEQQWKFNVSNCSTKNTVMVLHFRQIDSLCSNTAKTLLRIAGHNFCKLKANSCLILQKGWKVCDTVKNGFHQCSSKLWVFNKTSLPNVKLKSEDDAMNDLFSMTYHHLTCTKNEDSIKMSQVSETSCNQEPNVALIVLLVISITLLAILLLRIWRTGAVKILLNPNSTTANRDQGTVRDQEVPIQEHEYNPYSMASEFVNSQPLYTLARNVPLVQDSNSISDENAPVTNHQNE